MSPNFFELIAYLLLVLSFLGLALPMRKVNPYLI